MKRYILSLCLLLSAWLTTAQDVRQIQGVVMDKEHGTPIAGAQIANGATVVCTTGESGEFQTTISVYARSITIHAVGYQSLDKEVDGSYMVVKLAPAPEVIAERERRQAEERAKAAERERQRAEEELRQKVEAEVEAQADRLERMNDNRRAAEEAKIADRLRLASLTKAERRAEIKAQCELPRRGYLSHVDLSCLFVENDCLATLGYIGGYQFNNKLFLGLGASAGVSLKEDDVELRKGEGRLLPRGRLTVPFYLHLRYNILNRRLSPFVALSAGGYFSSLRRMYLELDDYRYGSVSYMINPQVGVNYRLSPKRSIYFAVGANLYNALSCASNNGLWPTMDWTLRCGVDFHLGISF